MKALPQMPFVSVQLTLYPLFNGGFHIGYLSGYGIRILLGFIDVRFTWDTRSTLPMLDPKTMTFVDPKTYVPQADAPAGGKR